MKQQRTVIRSKKWLRKRLEDRDAAAEYLTICFEEGPGAFLLGLRDVANARGGVGQAAGLCNIERQSLYRIFSRDGNPRLSSLDAILMGLELKVVFVSV